MKCPVCEKQMVEKDFGGVMVDVCADGCKGMWFDWMELGKLDEKNEGCGDALQEALKYPRVNDEGRPQLKCPKCGIKMKIHAFKLDQHVNVDECYSCGGIFLDSGELREIRDNTMSQEQHDEYLEKLLSAIPGVEQGKLKIADEQKRSTGLRRFTRFFRMSYYVTGI